MHPKPTNGSNADYPARIGNAIDALDRRLKGNLLDNGAFPVWLRGTSFNSGARQYGADRWEFVRVTGDAGATLTRQTGVSAQYATRMQRNAANASVTNITLSQSIETFNSKPAAGFNVTFKCRARCGANFSAASSAFFVQIFYGTGTDENVNTGFTGGVAQALSFAASTTQTTFEGTVAIPSTATQLGIIIFYTPVGAAGAADWLEVEEAQLVIGDYAGNYPYRHVADERLACARYFQQIYAGYRGDTTNGNNYGAPVSFPVPMRAAPTCTAASANSAPNSFLAVATADLSVLTAYGCLVTKAANATAANGIYNGTYSLSADL